MPTFPDYACIQHGSYAETIQPSVERTEMERGPPKQMRLNTRVMVQIQASLLFDNKADAALFEDWYFNEIGMIGWFDMEHPRTGAPISARFVGGDIGSLSPLGPSFSPCSRQVTIEYLR